MADMILAIAVITACSAVGTVIGAFLLVGGLVLMTRYETWKARRRRYGLAR